MNAREAGGERVEPLLIGYEDAAQSLGVAKITIAKMVMAKAIPHVRIGRRTLFRPADLKAWVAERRVPEAVR